ncbi:3-dehydroquinate synthase [Alsobacter sp. R-9]
MDLGTSGTDRTDDGTAAVDVPARLREALAGRSLVLVGMMGAGKSSVGRRLAGRLGLPFFDADTEIERAAGMTIPEIFAARGEAEFRDGERRVIGRLLAGGPSVIATGGGAFMSQDTRDRIAGSGLSIWLKADFDVLMRRVRKRSNRPLLRTADPEATLRKLIDDRYPVYALADITVHSRDVPHETVVQEIIDELSSRLLPGLAAPWSAAPQPHAREPATMTAPPPETVHVPLPGRAYDIVIGSGLIGSAGERIAALAPGAACGIVSDTAVADIHLLALRESLEEAGIRTETVLVPPGEGSKSYAMLQEVCDGLLAARLERGDLVVALGGGVVGDLAGFAAAVVRRGMRFVQVPTTLLAQVDSSVGGKTGINSRHGKNLVGAFHQPSLVLADVDVLDTLSPREFRAGYAEVVKYGLIDDPAFFAWLEEHHRGVFAGGADRVHAIRTSCAAKAAVVVRDEREDGDRALLNLGHTFAHAFERITAYDGRRLVHGEAVAIGLACAFRFSTRLGLSPGQDAGRVEGHLRTVGLPTRIREIPGWDAGTDAILDAMAQDKKVKRGALTFILARGIGQSFIARGVESDAVRSFLDAELAAP